MEIKEIKLLPKAAMLLGVAAVVCNIIMITWQGVPVSIACGIMGIGCAVASKENGAFTKKGKTAVVLATIGLVIGFIIYFLMLYSYRIMNDPELSKLIMEEMQNMMGSMPENLQEMLNSASHPQ